LTGALPAARGEWRFTQVTLFIWAWMLVAPGLEDRWLVQLLLQACLLNAVWMTLKVNPEWTGVRHLMIGLWLLAVAGSTLTLAPLPAGFQRLAQQLEAVASLPLFALLAAGILRFVYRSRRLTVDGIFATVAVYMLVAIAFAELYILLIGSNPSSFALPVPAAERSPNLLQTDMSYYSLITQCSVGYGDILPRSELARMVAVIQAVLGQFYMAVVVAVFVGMFASQRRD
jgi:uncharacterized membrane protein